MNSTEQSQRIVGAMVGPAGLCGVIGIAGLIMAFVGSVMHEESGGDDLHSDDD